MLHQIVPILWRVRRRQRQHNSRNAGSAHDGRTFSDGGTWAFGLSAQCQCNKRCLACSSREPRAVSKVLVSPMCPRPRRIKTSDNASRGRIRWITACVCTSIDQDHATRKRATREDRGAREESARYQKTTRETPARQLVRSGRPMWGGLIFYVSIIL